MVFAAGLLALLLGVLLLSGRSKTSRPTRSAVPNSDASGAVRSCPLCGEVLQAGQKVRSSVFATATTDKIMEIYGCPYCDTGKDKAPQRQRNCPVCHQTLLPTEVVTARVFERQDGRKTHVHVLGCPRCRSRTR